MGVNSHGYSILVYQVHNDRGVRDVLCFHGVYEMIVAVIIIGFILVYIFIVRPRIKTYRYVAGVLDDIYNPSVKGWVAISARFAGYKTVILSALAGVVPMLPSLLDGFKDFTGWTAFLEQGTANKISAVCAMLAMVTHAVGIEDAAKVEPKK